MDEAYPWRCSCVWIKYREGRNADNGEVRFRDTRMAEAAGLKSRMELSPKGVGALYIPRQLTRWLKADFAGDEDSGTVERIRRGFWRNA